MEQLEHIGIDEIRAGGAQPRSSFEELKLVQLAESIKQNGLLQPIIVQKKAGGGYELIAGERRWRAAHKAGLKLIPCVVMRLKKEEAFLAALVENIQRENLNPIEEAGAYQKMSEQFGLSVNVLAERVGKDRSSIANALRVLELPLAVQEYLKARSLGMGHGKALLGLRNKDLICKVAEKTIREGLSVRKLEDLVRVINRGGEKKITTANASDSKERELKVLLQRKFGGKVVVKTSKKGSVYLGFDFDSVECANRFLDEVGVVW